MATTKQELISWEEAHLESANEMQPIKPVTSPPATRRPPSLPAGKRRRRKKAVSVKIGLHKNDNTRIIVAWPPQKHAHKELRTMRSRNMSQPIEVS